MSFYSSETVDPIVQRLRILAKELPELKDAARVYEAILPILRDADLHAGTLHLTIGQVRDKMSSGVPLLVDLRLDFDVEAARALMIELAAAVEKHQTCNLRLPWLSSTRETGSAARRIRTALEENKLEADELLSSVASGDNNAIASAARVLGLDPGLTITLAQNALKPALRAWRGQLTPMVKGISWHKSTCFICGAPATLAELQDNAQAKHLRCASCGADWQVRRLQCAHCGNEDHNTLRYMYAEHNRDTLRVEACDACHGYLKIISAFSPAQAEFLAIEDLATLHLDTIARERSYKRSTVPAPAH